MAAGSVPFALAQTTVDVTAVTTVTEVVTAIETYCPGPTTITHGTHTYTVLKAGIFTITDCPCTITAVSIPPHRFFRLDFWRRT